MSAAALVSGAVCLWIVALLATIKGG